MEQLQQKDNLRLGSCPDRRRFLEIAIGVGTTSVIGISKTQRVRAAEGDEVWRFETGGYVDSSPTVLDGRVYVGSDSLYALSAGTGETEWSIGGSVSSSATVAAGTVFFGSFDQNLYAVDTGTGTEEWRIETGSRVNSSPTVMDGTVFFGGGNSVYALDAATGEEEWHFEIGDRIFSSPTLVEGTLFVGSWDNNVYALDAETGEKEWEFETNGSIGWSSPTVVDGLVFIGSRDRHVYGLDVRTGEEEWRFETGDWVSSSPTVIDGVVFVGSSDNNVYALTAETGEEKWRFETGDSVSSSPTVAEGVVFVGSDDKNVYALDAATGKEEWHFETGGSVFSSPIVVDGTVFVGSRDNYVYALETNVEGSSEGSRVLLGALGHHSERGNIDQLDSGTASTASGGTTVTETPVTGADETGQLGIQNRRDILPVALAFLGLGGAGVWWMSRSGDDDDDSRPTGGVTNRTVGSPSPTEPSFGRSTGDTLSDSALEEAHQQPVETDGVTIKKRFTPDEFSVPAVVVEIKSLRNEAIQLTLIESLPNDYPQDDIGFHPDYDQENWSFYKDNSIKYKTRLNPRESKTTVYGLRNPHHTNAEDFLTKPEITVSPPEELEIGDELQTDATRSLDQGDYDQALKTYAEARDAYKEALETAKKSDPDDLIDTDAIEQKLAEVNAKQQEVHRQQLQEEIKSLRSRLEHANRLADDGDIEEAKKRLDDLGSSLTSAKESADKHDFDDLYDQITALKNQQENYLIEITDRLKTHPIPDNIPRAPDVSVEYEALIDEEPIDSGGNADVLKATLPTPAGDVTLAIKKPKMPGGKSVLIEDVERILQEAETWDKLDDHDHIVGVVDYGSEPFPWIAMEYMDGGHLGERTRQMDIPQTLWTSVAVTKGVWHAHRHGVAHLDLKPQNVLFRTVNDAWDVPKVADWGLSKHLLEHSKSIEGFTPEYAAPEQFDTDEYGPADDVTDVYQLGAVFYEMFTGRPPFEGPPFEIMNKVKHVPPTPPSERSDVPEAIDDILLTALSKEKDDRYESVLLMRNDLQELFEEW